MTFSSLSQQQKIDALLKLKRDFRLHAETCLKLKAKDGALKPFKLNQVQDYVHDRLEQQRLETGKVRALILKARQQGISTYISARYYSKATMNTGRSVFILTHEDKATQNLFDMAKRYNDNNPIAPSTKNDNAKELSFAALDSGYGVGTAGAKAVGRSKTIQMLHGSEAAFWPNAASHFSGVVQAVPDLPDTEIILESTANGVGGEFHERWQMAERGEGDYIAIFIPWFWSDEYQRPVPVDFQPNQEEAEEQRLYNLSNEQLVWRRAKIAELKDPLLFKQEYPATAAEAFQMTGHDGFIKSPIIMSARKNKTDGIGPLVIGADPARFGDDLFALAWRRGRKVEKVESKPKTDVVEGANWLRMIIDSDAPDAVFIDAGGVGGGVYDMLKNWGKPYSDIVRAVNFGGKPHAPQTVGTDGRYLPGPSNRRAEMWSNSRDWLEDVAGVDIPDMDVLQADACGPSYRYNTNQELVLESKEDMRKRGVKSPDYWDAIALTFAEPVKVRNSLAQDRYGKKPQRRSAWAS